MFDSLGAKGVRSALARRDQVMNGDNNLTSDRIALVFDTFRDKNSRNWFELNPDGVRATTRTATPPMNPSGEVRQKSIRLDGRPDFRSPFPSSASRARWIRGGGCRPGARATGA